MSRHGERYHENGSLVRRLKIPSAGTLTTGTTDV